MSNETKFVTPTDTDPVLSWETDEFRRCNYFSETFCAFAGLSSDEMSGEGWTTIVHPDDLEQLMKVSGEAFEHRLPFALEARFRRSDGVYRWFLNVGTPRFSEHGKFIGFSGTNFDISQSKQIELARVEEQRRLRAILEHSSTMIALLDTDFHYIYTNGPYAAFWNETPNSIAGRYVFAVTKGVKAEDAKKKFEDAAKGLTVAFEFNATRQGKPRTLLVKYVRNVDAQGNLLGFYVFADDVTEIRETARQFELILNNLPADVAYFDRDMELQYGNRAFFECVGCEPGEVKGRKMVDVIGTSNFDYAQHHIARAFEGETVFFERDEDKRHTLVYLVPNLDSKGQAIGVFTLELDISPLKRAEAQLRKSDRQFELAMQGPQVGFWESDLDGHEKFLTENIECLLGLPAGKLENRRELFYQRVHPDDIERVRKTDQRQITETGSHVCEYRLLMADDRYNWFRSVGESELDSDGKYIRSAGTIANIDNLKKAELEAAAQVRNRDVFMSMLSHELRNPLSAIRYAVDYCRESGTLHEDHQKMFEIISRQTEHTSRMLSDLLDVTRIAGNQLLFEKETLDLTELLDSTATATRHLYHSRNQTFEVSIQPGLITFGDGARLQQAFTNLLDNASKYSPENATIRLSASLRQNEALTVKNTLAADNVQIDEQLMITVEDDGPGISTKDQRNIFELFFQKERSIDRSGGGLGLGLYLVREIVVAHGGEVSVESHGPGQGSRFVIRLLPTTLKTINPSDQSGPRFSPCKIVLVEDNRDARLALTHTLVARGCDVISYSDGLQASNNLPQDVPDVAIIDIGLPNKSGLELMKEMSEIGSLQRTCFIALTGYGQLSDQREIAAAGFETHLVKPIEVGQMLQMIAERLALRSEFQPEQSDDSVERLADKVRLANPATRSDL